jgi:hypothetical protein
MKLYEHFYKHQKYFEFLDKLKIKPWHWLSLSAILAGADFISKADIQFPILYILPIVLAGWSGKRNHALVLAIVLPCIRLIFHMIWNIPWLAIDSIVNVLIRFMVFIILAYLISFARELHVMRGFLHVCSYCDRIKNDNGVWIPLQEYIIYHSEAMLSHGICPDCVPKYTKIHSMDI